MFYTIELYATKNGNYFKPTSDILFECHEMSVSFYNDSMIMFF